MRNKYYENLKSLKLVKKNDLKSRFYALRKGKKPRFFLLFKNVVCGCRSPPLFNLEQKNKLNGGKKNGKIAY